MGSRYHPGMKRILFVTAEASPYAQTGGMGEVCGSLPKSLARQGCEVRLLLPAYGGLKARLQGLQHRYWLQLPGHLGACEVLGLPIEPGLELWLLDAPQFFDRPGGLYVDENGRDWHDNAHRFACFSRAAAELAMSPVWRPDIVHCHDWQTGLVPALLSRRPEPPRSVFTIHNLAFTGRCDRGTYDQLQLPLDWWNPGALEFYGDAAFIKGGLVFADRITAVSPTYAWEITTPAGGYGLDGLLRSRGPALSGILNGIDAEEWDPVTDPLISANYSAEQLGARAPNKAALQALFGLPQDPSRCLVGVVSRLTDQKGTDLLVQALRDPRTAGLQCVILGSGDPHLEHEIRWLAGEQPQRVGVRCGYDVALSHQIFAGVDAFAMPSRFEPCGLGQLYSLRYGAIPVVRQTGGLADSVREGLGGTGFVFHNASAGELAAALARMHDCYRKPYSWQILQRRGMGMDHSWDRSAQSYLDLYAAV